MPGPRIVRPLQPDANFVGWVPSVFSAATMPRREFRSANRGGNLLQSALLQYDAGLVNRYRVAAGEQSFLKRAPANWLSMKAVLVKISRVDRVNVGQLRQIRLTPRMRYLIQKRRLLVHKRYLRVFSFIMQEALACNA
jgi:hypothetical protein